jgi:hypothetical protein
VNTGCNLAESSQEGYDSKRAVLPMMMMMMMMMMRMMMKTKSEVVGHVPSRHETD